jgi:hypothetical protein
VKVGYFPLLINCFRVIQNLEQAPDKTFISKICREFGFLGYHFAGKQGLGKTDFTYGPAL